MEDLARAIVRPLGAVAVCAALVAGGCARPGDEPAAAPAPAAAPERAQPPEPTTAPGRAPLVVFLGDSLTAGYGLAEADAYPSVVARRLAADGVAARVVNAGVSGDTSAGGVARLDWLLRQKPAVVVLELGANDGLRGEPLSALEENLRQAIRRSEAVGARVVLAGMKLPPSYGADYARGFEALYPRVAKETGAALIPFLLEDVAAEPGLNQGDGIHPTAAGARKVAENVLAVLEPILRALERRK